MREVVASARRESTEVVERLALADRPKRRIRWMSLAVPVTAVAVGLWSGLLLDPILWGGTAMITLVTGWLLPRIARRR